jgi:hypothetical protein
MLDNFVASPFGQEVSSNCAMRMIGNVSPRTKLLVTFGLGTKQAYVESAFDLYSCALAGDWHWINGLRKRQADRCPRRALCLTGQVAPILA